MKVVLRGIRAVRGEWSLWADGIFDEGVHLVSGDIGSGKSTLALILAGLFPPESGTVERDGIASVMMGFQFPEFHVTGSDLESECRSWGLDPGIVLSAAGLTGKNNADPLNLSRGELKRLINTCLLLEHHDLLILDEPFSSLDCSEKRRLSSSISRRSKGITIIFTHEQGCFPRVDRIWEIQDGRLLDRGRLPSALNCWNHAPSFVKNLIARGKTPRNVAESDLLEAACRI